MNVRLKETVEVKQNLKLVMRERGKIVARRDGHNIWLDLGREYLAALISLVSYSPDIPERNDRIKFMGFGIGGTRQLALPTANSAPISPPYTGTNLQTDTDPTVSVIERPVRLSGSTSAYPGLAGDIWIGKVQAPATHASSTEVTFKRLFTQTEISYSTFLSVPLSEIGLMTNLAVENNFQNTLVAYDTFDTLSKTSAFELEVDWTVRF